MNLTLVNGDFRTEDPHLPRADTVVIRDGHFEFVGAAADRTVHHDEQVVDLQGRMVLPGIIDAHTHPVMVAQSRWHVALPESHDVDEILGFIRDYGHAHPRDEAPFLYFEYYPTTLFEGGTPRKELLDTAISDRPVLCQDSGDHASWVNSRMLELMGVDAQTPDPVPGLERFVRDEDGTPTGQVLESAHLGFLPVMYERIGWTPPEEPTPELIGPVFRFFSEHGVTAIFEALIEERQHIAAVSDLDRRGELNMQYEGAARFRSRADLDAAIQRARAWDAEFGSDTIRIRTLKLFLDGTNELGNSAVLEPLVSDDNAGPSGAIQMEQPELTDCIVECNRMSIDLHIHMVGDRAFRTACDAVEEAQRRVLAAGGVSWDIQVTFAHCELVDPADMERPAELGIIVNWTNHWSGGYFGEEGVHHLGEQRWNRMYEFTTMADAGTTVTFSSDVVSQAELYRADPFLGMQIAATRVDPDGPLDPARFPGSVRPSVASRLTVDRLLTGYTMDAARQLRIADRHGSISVGKVANLVVIDRDLFDTPTEHLGEVRAETVMFRGEIVAGALPHTP